MYGIGAVCRGESRLKGGYWLWGEDYKTACGVRVFSRVCESAV